MHRPPPRGTDGLSHRSGPIWTGSGLHPDCATGEKPHTGATLRHTAKQAGRSHHSAPPFTFVRRCGMGIDRRTLYDVQDVRFPGRASRAATGPPSDRQIRSSHQVTSSGRAVGPPSRFDLPDRVTGAAALSAGPAHRPCRLAQSVRPVVRPGDARGHDSVPREHDAGTVGAWSKCGAHMAACPEGTATQRGESPAGSNPLMAYRRPRAPTAPLIVNNPVIGYRLSRKKRLKRRLESKRDGKRNRCP